MEPLLFRLGPTINIHRSPLGGRGFECLSEDPVLSGKLAVSIIRGLQDNGIAACPKVSLQGSIIGVRYSSLTTARMSIALSLQRARTGEAQEQLGSLATSVEGDLPQAISDCHSRVGSLDADDQLQQGQWCACGRASVLAQASIERGVGVRQHDC